MGDFLWGVLKDINVKCVCEFLCDLKNEKENKKKVY